VNREYMTLKEKVATLTAGWEGLAGEAERIDADLLPPVLFEKGLTKTAQVSKVVNAK